MKMEILTDQKLADDGIVVKHYFASGVYIKQMTVPAGLAIGKHVHDFDHFSTLLSGDAVISVNGVLENITAPKTILIEAGKEHVIVAKTAIVWHCIHATNEADPEKVDIELMAVA